jgi:hypothetical protein
MHYDRTTDETSAARDLLIDQFVQCWILGDKYDIKEFQDLIITEVIDLVRGTYVSLDSQAGV